MPENFARQLHDITSLLTSWATSIGAARARSAQELLWLRGDSEDEDGTAHYYSMVLLLVNVRLLPKVQYLAGCESMGGESDFGGVLQPTPFRVKIAIRAHRVCPTRKAVQTWTSDELAEHLFHMWPQRRFSLAPMTSNITCDLPSLLYMDIIGVGAAYVPPARRAKRALEIPIRTCWTSATP